MASQEEFSSVQVLYQLSWDHGKLEHPHMIEVQYPANQDGLRLRDVKKRLTTLRGHGIVQSFSWSYKRNYRNTFIWNDLCDDDVIHPLRGTGEYLMKASELLNTIANKPAEPLSKYQSEDGRSMPLEKAARKRSESKNLPTLSIDQETIDVEKSDFCLSSSDNETSPRPTLVECNTKPAQDRALTRSPTVEGLRTPPKTSLTSPTELPASPSSAKRVWKREIRKSLFRPTARNVSAAEAPANRSDREEALPRSKTVTPSNLDVKEEEHSTPQLIRSLWARWTGATGKMKRSSPPEIKPRTSVDQSLHSITTEIKSIISMQADSPPASVTSCETELDASKKAANSPIPEPLPPQPRDFKKEKAVLSLEIPNAPDSPTSDTQSEAETDTPKLAIARVKMSHDLPKVRTARPLPPGFHKGTNDTKPVQTPRRCNLRSFATPLASPPPLMRSLSRDAKRSLSARGASIAPASSPESKNSVASPESRPVKKCITFRERDERPLQPGLTNLDWEKALQEAVINCLPPPNFGDNLEECSTCGRTFKPDSLQVHKRGCHPPHYARAFSARASPMVRSRAA